VRDVLYTDTWESRKKSLEEKGYSSYKEFLESSRWKELKNRAKKHIFYKSCRVCKTQNEIDLHHKDYCHLHSMKSIIPLCRGCHDRIHEYAKETGFSVRLATRYCLRISQGRTIFNGLTTEKLKIKNQNKLIKRMNRKKQ
jgi:N-glycosylase/DNA lyase